MIAGPRNERLNVLSELVRWAQTESKARAAGEHQLALQASMRMREAVGLLGFDPLEYEPGRDACEQIINRRERAMLRAMPCTTSDLAKAAGINPRHVSAYLHRYISRGEVTGTKRHRTTYWEVVS